MLLCGPTISSYSRAWGLTVRPLPYRLELAIEDLQRSRGERALLSRMPEVKRCWSEEIGPHGPREATVGSCGSGPVLLAVTCSQVVLQGGSGPQAAVTRAEALASSSVPVLHFLLTRTTPVLLGMALSLP